MTSNGVFNENKKMTKEPKLPHKLKWGNRTAARVDEVDYLIGIRVVGYTCIEDVIIAEVHESVADEVGAWNLPNGELKSTFGGWRVYEEAASRGILQVYKA
mgnify:CR=1 FL=1